MPSTPAPALPAQVSPPQFALTAQTPAAVRGVAALAYPVFPMADSVLLGPDADALAEEIGLDLFAVLEAARATGRAGEVTQVPVARDGVVQTVLLVGVGEQEPQHLRRAGAALARATRNRESVVTSLAAGTPDGGLEAFVVGMMLGSFGFHWRSDGPAERPVAHVVLAGLADPEEQTATLARALAVGGAAWQARTLATVPSNLKSPAWLAEQAVRAGADAGLEVTVWDETDLQAHGMGGLLAVGRASATPPRLIRLDYAPPGAHRRTPRVVLVGKGITFDTGGLSIKPAESMATMKRDMTGGGVVIAVLSALAQVGCPVRVTGLVAAAENAVGGDAVRPGDVVVHYGGRTTEVTNTDAEGRLVLADALAYAVDKLRPAALVDVATLTGAAKVALGQRVAGYFANHDGLAATLARAGDEAGEPLWRLPLHPDYEEKLASKVADADNAPGGPGAITAALFLQHFVGDVPWAHLDIASVGDAPSDSFEWSQGPTGFGARALLRWLGTDDPLAGLR
ncbi:MAG TPA: leucyl aminopeptidase [Nocardioides sp.]|uniref:leucyl aminopeptidase n=1 Tax=Nocardioides sp. TaxID=35761 RepID=UPI002C5F8142|nr:leucyl aminopeptidase [Nocardioides sp.]HQR25602.1 leucyl aminopeptidase [Nocardioides sp.]